MDALRARRTISLDMKRALPLLFVAACVAPPTSDAPPATGAAGESFVEAPMSSASAREPLRELYERDPSLWPAPTLDAGIPHRELALVPARAATTDPVQRAREELGSMLYFDARISGNGQLACASCHDAELGFGDGRAASFGEGFLALPRNAPTLLNASLRTTWFWDGRARTLQAQALAVFTNPREMHTSAEDVVAKLASSHGYRGRFAAAFGDETVSIERTLDALAAFESTLVSDGSSAFDAFLEGRHDALSDSAVRGLHLFRTSARCLNCHYGPLLTDEQFHNLGLTYYGRELQDLGRFEVTKDPRDVGRFRTPSLRNLGRTGPYMHNGLFELEGVIGMYSAGMPRIVPKPEQVGDPLFPVKSPLIQALDLTRAEKSDLLEFLNSLTERKRRLRAPALPALFDV